jgi:hypothetical protein
MTVGYVAALFRHSVVAFRGATGVFYEDCELGVEEIFGPIGSWELKMVEV